MEEKEEKKKGRPRKSLLEVAAKLPAVDMTELCNAFDEENKKQAQEDALNSTFAAEKNAETRQAFLSNYVSLGECNNDAEKLTLAQIEALGKVIRTDKMLDEMFATLEEAGANQRWLDEAKNSFCCGMMEIYRAICKPQGI